MGNQLSASITDGLLWPLRVYFVLIISCYLVIIAAAADNTLNLLSATFISRSDEILVLYILVSSLTVRTMIRSDDSK